MPELLKILSRDSFIIDLDAILNAVYVLVGLACLLHGMNILNTSVSVSVWIDDNKLYFNSSPFDKTISLFWSEIECFEIKANRLIVHFKRKEVREIELGWIPCNDLISIKMKCGNLLLRKE